MCGGAGCAGLGKEKKIIERGLEEAGNQGLVDWGCREGILENEVDNYREMDNYEPEEEKQSNNAIEESQ